MGKVDDDQLGAQGGEPGQGPVIQLPAAGTVGRFGRFCEGPAGDAAAKVLDDVEQGVVAGGEDDDLVIGLEEGVQGAKDALFGGAEAEDLAGIEFGVHLGDLGAEGGRALGLGVAQVLIAQGAGFCAGEGEKLVHGEGFAVGSAEDVGCGELVLGEIAFSVEGLDFHLCLLFIVLLC